MSYVYRAYTNVRAPGWSNAMHYPLDRAKPVRLSLAQRFAGTFLLMTAICVFAGLAFLLVQYVGWDALAELHGGDRLVAHLDVGSVR